MPIKTHAIKHVLVVVATLILACGAAGTAQAAVVTGLSYENDPSGYFEMDGVSGFSISDENTVAMASGGTEALFLGVGPGGIPLEYSAEAALSIQPTVPILAIYGTVRLDYPSGDGFDFELQVHTYDQEGGSETQTFMFSAGGQTASFAAMTDSADGLGTVSISVDPGLWDGGVTITLIDFSVGLLGNLREGYTLTDYSDSESIIPSNMLAFGGSQAPFGGGGGPVPELPLGAQGIIVSSLGYALLQLKKFMVLR